MSKIEAIVVNGIRYDNVKAKTEFVCEECELRDECEVVPYVKFAVKCNVLTENNECWKRCQQ